MPTKQYFSINAWKETRKAIDSLCRMLAKSRGGRRVSKAEAVDVAVREAIDNRKGGGK